MKYLTYFVIACLTILLPFSQKLIPKSEKVGTITSISELKSDPLPHRLAQVQKDSEVVTAVLYDTNIQYMEGDEVVLQTDPQFENLYSVTDKVRTGALLKLFILFVIVILLISGEAGLRSLLGLLFSFSIIFKFVLPQILLGSNPLTVALLASFVILLVSYLLTHGVSNKTMIAIFGTFGALIVTGVLALLYAKAASLSGFSSEEVAFLIGNIKQDSFYNLMLAGIIIGSLGVLDDITISQASIVSELSEANHRLGIAELYKRAMNIGRDHISSLVNTLVLVYAGSALPLLLLFVTSQATPIDLLNYEVVAEEIVRTLVSTIGLVTAVPITTMIASYWYGSKR